MKLVTWNCQGAWSPFLLGIMKDFRSMYGVNFVALLKTQMSGTRANMITSLLGFDGSCILDAKGFSSGIWCLWSKDHLNVELVIKHK